MRTVTREMRESLVQEALAARAASYAPYSNYPVGAAVLAGSGKVYRGANIENASYPATVCAERVAAYKALSEGERELVAIAVVSDSGGFPCGICRQVLNEFNGELVVIVANGEGEISAVTALDRLLPHAFGPQDLNR